MTSVKQTAYPRLDKELTQKELADLYTTTDDELSFVQNNTRSSHQKLALLIALKCVQHVGYFPLLSAIPKQIQQFLCKSLALPASTLPIKEAERTRYRHRNLIRTYLDLKPYRQYGRELLDDVVIKAAETMSHPADLVNIALEQLNQAKIELPSFYILNRRIHHLRQRVHQQIYQQVLSTLPKETRAQLDHLLTVPDGAYKSGFNRLNETPGKATLKNFRIWENRLAWLNTQVRASQHLETLTHTKIKQFADQARANELSDLLDIQDIGKRYTLLLCLIHDAQVSTRDQLTQMFLRRMALIKRNAKDKLARLREEYLDLNEHIVATFGEIAESAVDTTDDQALGQQVRQILNNQGGAEKLAQHTQFLSAYHNNNYLPLMWGCYRQHRSLLFILMAHLNIQSATQDQTVIEAITFIKNHQSTRRKFLPSDISLAFASQRWQQLIMNHNEGELQYDRKCLEVCIFNYLALHLSRGDLFIVGSEEYGDYRKQLLPWDECEPKVVEYCQSLGIPANGAGFVQHLRQELTDIANKIDQAFPENADLTIDADGRPHLKRLVKREKPEKLTEFKEALKSKLPERHLLDILKYVHHWVGYTRHFGPPSGATAKMADPDSKYLVTVFGYGSGMGAAQTERHTRGIITKRSMKRLNDQHVTINKLDVAIQDIINEYGRFYLPFIWGTGKHVVADGTHFKLLDNNLLGQHHFRYGEYGAIAYHHISDTYIALFSHFITCGVWEAVFILDGLLKNESIIQPDTIHADTQGQTLTVFGLAYLLGIDLMPRMRNWNKVDLCRPDRQSRYKHIDRLFTGVINWRLIERHWRDLVQVILSIQAGKVLPSMLLQKLGSHNKQNKLYKVFAEVGRVIRTIFLLKYLSNVEMRQEIHTATTVVERFNGFLAWLNFGGDGIMRSRDPIEQEKQVKYLNLIANAVILQNVVDMTDALSEMANEGYNITRDLVQRTSPYMTEHIRRFGQYVLDMTEIPLPLSPDKPFLTEPV